MHRFLAFAIALAVASSGSAEEKWNIIQSGPFRVLTTEGDKPARETMNYLEQLRHAIGLQLGEPSLQSSWPIQILVVDKNTRDRTYPVLRFARESWIASTPSLQPEVARGVASVLMDSWSGQIPPSLKRGLVTLYSTLSVDGTRLALGTPPDGKDRDWARAHMLAVNPDYSGKLRVLLYNLGKGLESDSAYRNAFGKLPSEIELALDRYIEAGQYSTIPVSGKPINAQREFVPKRVDATVGEIALADLLFAHEAQGARDAYQAVLTRYPESAQAREGLGLLFLASQRQAEARPHLEAAASGGSARALVEYGKLVSDVDTKRDLFVKAAKANANWAEPYRQLAALESTPSRKAHYLNLAVKIDTRDLTTWIALAQAQEAAKEFAAAAKSWTSAERATDDSVERERIRLARQDIERRRVEQQIAEREEARRKADQDVQDLRNRALAEIRAAEARANAGKPVLDPSTLDRYEGEKSSTLEGVLQRVDCRGQRAILHIASGKQMTRILIPDSSSAAIDTGGEKLFACGPQRPPKKVEIKYESRADSRFGTAGDAVLITFRK